MLRDSIFEQAFDRGAGGQVTLVDGDGQVLVRALQLILQFRGAVFAGGGVVVQSEIGAFFRQTASDLCAQVLAAASDESCLAAEGHCRDGDIEGWSGSLLEEVRNRTNDENKELTTQLV